MTLAPLAWTRLEKAAYDNGFDVEGPPIDDWRTFSSSQTSLRIWLGAIGDKLFIVAFSRWEVFEALEGLGIPWKNPLPSGAAAARSASELIDLHHLLRRAYQLSRALPDEPLQLFLQQTSNLPRATEAERMVVQRVGQDIFRRGLLDYWEGRCAITGLAVVELLRASHIKPWADCAADAERLDVFNGLLLSPHFDAAFDGGFISLGEDDRVVISPVLNVDARRLLGLGDGLQVPRLQGPHRGYLAWHRSHVFRAEPRTDEN